MFTLHPQLERDTAFVADGKLSRILFMNNQLFPWAILVPRVDAVREIIDLQEPDRHVLMNEISHLSRAMQAVFAADKLNIAALGNQVPQLHVHVIARKQGDAAWPNPVWGGPAKLYGDVPAAAAPLADWLAANPFLA